MLRPSVDFVVLCAVVVASLGGVEAVVHVTSIEAPLLALPPLVLALFYLRGLYRTRIRTLALDGVVPGLSAVSVAAMAVALLGWTRQWPDTAPVRLADAHGCSRWPGWASAACCWRPPSAWRAPGGWWASRS